MSWGPVPAMGWWWCYSGNLLCVLSLLTATAVRAPATAEDQQHNEAANTGSQADDEVKMAIDPALDFFADGTVGTLTLKELSNMLQVLDDIGGLHFGRYHHQYMMCHPESSAGGHSMFRVQTRDSRS
jgi:hypothetical protein